MQNNKLIVSFKKEVDDKRGGAEGMVKQMSLLFPLASLKVNRLFPMDMSATLPEKENYPEKLEGLLRRTFKVECVSEDQAAFLMDYLRANEAVDYVQYDCRNKLHKLPEPDDPFFSKQWAMAKMNWEQAWDKVGKLEKIQEVIVAVIDTGIDDQHPDIAANMWMDADGNHGKDFTTLNGRPTDNIGHGTHIAGIIAAVSNNASGISGVAPFAKVMAVKVGSEPFDADGAGAICYAVRKGANIINISWGSAVARPENEVLKRAIDYAVSRNVVVVCSSGNDNDMAELYTPANHPDVICVGATDRNDERACNANYGSAVAVAAPGQYIVSLMANSINYKYLSGTSMAAPQVTGLVALMLGINPGMRSKEIKEYILQSVDPIRNNSSRLSIGSGRINIAKCIDKTINELPGT